MDGTPTPRPLSGMASGVDVANVLACGAWLDQGPLFVFATQLPVDPLGRHLIGPLGQRLSEVGATGIVLIPVGLLSVFPLHAASYRAEGRETSLLEQFDVAYAPSVRVLTAARHQ